MKLNQITLAVFSMEAMVTFYRQIFGLIFRKEEMAGYTLFRAEVNGFDMLFCPAELAGNDASSNRHQLHLSVKDLAHLMEQVPKHGGSVLQEIVDHGLYREAAIRDPDQNSLVLRQTIF
jgi:predicted enzyme related to lactoylglutathione lyase